MAKAQYPQFESAIRAFEHHAKQGGADFMLHEHDGEQAVVSLGREHLVLKRRESWLVALGLAAGRRIGERVERANAPTTALIIDHRHGLNTSVHKNREDAESYLFTYVGEWWEQEDRLKGRTMPADPQAAINAYFTQVDDEGYTIGDIDNIGLD
jgi:hypothetical protein